jgi:hypothetical protein
VLESSKNRRFDPAGRLRSTTLGGLACLVLATPAPAAPGSEPRLEIARAEIDLGTVGRGRQVGARFELANTGEGDLHLLRVEPECACTVVDYDETIPPGGVGHLAATLDTSRVKGSLRRLIGVETDDPSRPHVTLTLRADVVTSIEILPSDAVLLRTRPGHDTAARVLVRKDSTEAGKLVVRDLVTSEEWLTAKAEELTARRPAGGGLPEGLPGDWLIDVALKGWPTTGHTTASVRFATGLPREPTSTITLDVETRPPVNVSSLPVDHAASPDGSARGTVFLSVREGLDPAELRIVDAAPEQVGARLEPAGGRMYRLHVEWRRSREASGTVKLQIGGEAFDVPLQWSEPSVR